MPQLTLLAIIAALFMLMLSISSAQEDDELFEPPTVLSSSNLGVLQPLTIAEVLQYTNLNSWHNAGWMGDGRRVGVLDRGFGGLLEFTEHADVNVRIASYDSFDTYNANTIFHGVQVAEVVINIAPDVELLLCEYSDLLSYVACIDWMIINDTHIIVHSAGVPALPLDGTSRWAQEVNRAANNGILWVNAAGNFAGGLYKDVFTPNNNRRHEFRGVSGNNELLAVPALEISNQGVVMLSWGDHANRPANTIDLDLEVVDIQTGHVIAGSYQRQNGGFGQLALEYVVVDFSRPFAVRIIGVDENAVGTEFSLFVEFTRLPGGEALSNIITPADAQGSLTVAAIQGIDPAPYSSRGPLMTAALKPDIATYGEITLDSGQFVGTSAAAPVIAGAAALVWQANPDFLLQDIRDFMFSTTQGFGAFDFAIGRGRMLMPLPQATAIAPTDSPEPTLTATLTNTPEPIMMPTNTSDITVQRMYVGVDTAFLRSEPNTRASIMDRIEFGTLVNVLEQVEGELFERSTLWYRVSHGNRIGYIHGNLLAESRPSERRSEPQPTVCASGRMSGNASDLFSFEGRRRQTVYIPANTTITIQAQITNAQDQWGVGVVLENASGVIVASGDIWHTSGANSVSFSHVATTSGNYRVGINGDSTHIYSYNITWNCQS